MSDTIKILVDDVSPEPSSRAVRPSLEELLRSAGGKTIELDVETLGTTVASAYGRVLNALSSLPSADSFQLQSVAFSLVVDSTGGVSLASAVSGSVKTQAGLTFVITRTPAGVTDAKVSKA